MKSDAFMKRVCKIVALSRISTKNRSVLPTEDGEKASGHQSKTCPRHDDLMQADASIKQHLLPSSRGRRQSRTVFGKIPQKRGSYVQSVSIGGIPPLPIQAHSFPLPFGFPAQSRGNTALHGRQGFLVEGGFRRTPLMDSRGRGRNLTFFEKVLEKIPLPLPSHSLLRRHRDRYTRERRQE